MMDEPQIRTATPADVAAIDALTQAAYAKWVPILGRKPLPMTADYARAVVEHRIDVIERDGAIVALLELEPQPDHLLIVNLAVHPAAQGAGLGRRMLLHAESVAGKLGVDEMRLYTNGLMAANIALYERHGYRIDRRETRGPGWIVVHMAKTIGGLGPLAAADVTG